MNEFNHNHHLSKAKMLVNISDVEFRFDLPEMGLIKRFA